MLCGFDLYSARASKRCITGLLLTLLGACTVVGPKAVMSGRMAYNEAINETNNQQMLKVFVNNPDCARSNWIAYLKNQLRDAFGLEGAPIFVKLVARSRPEK